MKISDFAKKTRKTIVFKLILTVIVIFLAMTGILYFCIGIYQGHIMDKIATQLEMNLEEVEKESGDGTFLVIQAEEAAPQSEFLIYSSFIFLAVIFLGGTIFYVVITRMMKPLKQLADEVSEIDMEQASYVKNKVLIENGGMEIQELSRVLDGAFSEIYESYERQKKFSVNVAHEVRTPLAILSAKIDVFKKKKTEDPEEIRRFVDSMQKNIARLSDMVEGIMMLSQKQEVRTQAVNLREILDEILFDLEDMAAEKEVALSLEGDNVVAHTDEQLIERVLFNLVENGIKYNREGGNVQVSTEDLPDRVKIRIADTGVGIREEDKPHVFDLFYRVDESRNRETGGYGIGLALVRHIVGRLGGTISLADNLPRGSVFEVCLPKTGNGSEVGKDK